MPRSSFKLVPGVNTTETPVLNESSGISFSNLIRFFYDRNGGLAQKLGGWTKFFSTPMVAVVRALWAWEDLDLDTRLAIGTENLSGQTYAQLAVIENGVLSDITPTESTSNIAPVITTMAGSSIVSIIDTSNPGITNYDSVYIATQISIGGIVLFGLYQCDPTGLAGPNGFTITSTDQLGNPLPATNNDSMPVLPSFTTVGPVGLVAGAKTVSVNLPNNGYQVGDTFPVLASTQVGGITLYGNYVVQQIIDINNFQIIATSAATSNDNQTLNSGLARYIYTYGTGAIPAGTGYGAGGYGFGGYGTGSSIVPATGEAIPALDWTLDNWGEILIACAIQVHPDQTPFQGIYFWNEGQGSAYLITAAPPINDGIFVAMPQRQIVAWGSTETGIPDPLLIRWCDVNNYNTWIPLVTNQAGSYRIPKGSKIVGCAQGAQQALVWTDIDVWSMQYIGPPYVYSFNEIGDKCGLIARKAAAFVNGVCYWMGPSQFYTLGADGVVPVPCDVWDVVFQNLDQNNLQKIRVAVNSRFGEIQWFYPSLAGNGEIDSYVKFNVYLNVWDYGSLGRTAWIDQSVLGPPVGADPSTLYLYQHETSNDADGAAMNSNLQTGYFATAEGDQKTFVDWIWPDMKWGQISQPQTATVQITFYVKDYPADTPQVFGPYSVTQATEYFYTRLRGRLVSVSIGSSDLGSFWRCGAIRYRYAPDGRV